MGPCPQFAATKRYEHQFVADPHDGKVRNAGLGSVQDGLPAEIEHRAGLHRKPGRLPSGRPGDVAGSDPSRRAYKVAQNALGIVAPPWSELPDGSNEGTYRVKDRPRGMSPPAA